MSNSAGPIAITVIDGDVRFDVEIGGQWQTFRVTREALEDLDGIAGNFDRITVFIKHQERIVEVAKRMIDIGVENDEIIIKTEFFR